MAYFKKPAQPRIFFGYPSRPETLRATVSQGADMIGKSGIAAVSTWEQLRVGGKVVISAIMRAIEDADLSCFDVTSPNHNVMFELGFAIGAEKIVWPIIDSSVLSAESTYKKIHLLSGIGFVRYKNAEHILQNYLNERPHEGTTTIFRTLIEPALIPMSVPQLFYMRLNHETEADRILTRRINEEKEKGLRCVVDDTAESRFQPVDWYAKQVYTSDLVIAHLAGPTRRDNAIHNARCALICGLAAGMKKKIFMLCEYDYEVPVDYQNLSEVYKSPRQCVEIADSWLSDNLEVAYKRIEAAQDSEQQLHLKTELRAFNLGEYVAENEERELVDYFVITRSFQEVLDRKTTVFIGSKGTGKTANFLQAANVLAEDKRNLVVVIKPAGYELSSLLSLLQKYIDLDSKGYLVESLWKFLLYTEIAWATVKSFQDGAVGPDSAEWELKEYMQDPARGLDRDFAVRLERAVDALNKLPSLGKLEDTRMAISEALHEGVLRELRSLLGKTLKRKARVAVLIDNLDKAWERGKDLDLLCEMLLGLLTSIGRVSQDFGKRDDWREPVSVTLAVFIRSDIFARVVTIAREPDKIPTSRLSWNDPTMLLRVIEERYVASKGTGARPEEIWQRFFCPSVGRKETKLYLCSRVLPRPRDILYLCNSAISHSINRGHHIVQENDILDAERSYSQFAFEALHVSNGLTWSDLERVLYEFVGVPTELSYEEFKEVFVKAKIDVSLEKVVLDYLCSVSFLGIEISDGEFAFTDDPRQIARNEVAARKLGEARRMEPRYQVHPAYRCFLEIVDL